MPLKRLELIAQLSAARVFWKPTIPLLKHWLKIPKNCYTEIENTRKKAENAVRRSRSLPWGLKIIINEGLKKIEKLHIEFLYWFETLPVDLSITLEQNEYTKTLLFDSLLFLNFATADNTLDEDKLMRELVNDPKCDLTLRFLISCHYCFEDYLRLVDNKHDEIIFEDKYMVNFWLDYLQNPEKTGEFWKRKFELSTGNSPHAEVIFFWNKLSPTEKSSYTDNINKMVSLILGCHEKTMQFLFSLLTPEIHNAVLERCCTVYVFQRRVIQGLMNPRCDTQFFKCLWMKVKRINNCWGLLSAANDFRVEQWALRDEFCEVVKFLWVNIKHDMRNRLRLVSKILWDLLEVKELNCFRLIAGDVPSHLEKQLFKYYKRDLPNTSRESVEFLLEGYELFFQCVNVENKGSHCGKTPGDNRCLNTLNYLAKLKIRVRNEVDMMNLHDFSDNDVKRRRVM